jgi:carbon-monoxide dehydrogenase iron sulfur subunit
MKRVYVNEKWCLGCHLCEYNCAFAQTGMTTTMAEALKGVKINPNIRVDQTDSVCFAVNCRHCDNPLCVKSCITGALSRDENGVITIDQQKCVHCFTCVVSCPYGCVLPTDSGAITKCQLCVSTSDGIPKCVQGCPNNAIVFEER